MRGVAYSIGERELLMKMHQQGKSLEALSLESGVARPVLSRWWLRYCQEGRAALGGGGGGAVRVSFVWWWRYCKKGGGGLNPRSRRPHRLTGLLGEEVE